MVAAGAAASTIDHQEITYTVQVAARLVLAKGAQTATVVLAAVVCKFAETVHAYYL